MLSWSLSPPRPQSFLSAPLFDPEGISYMICGAGQTDRSSSASGQFYYAPDISSRFNTLPQLQLQLSEKRRSCFLIFFARISWTNLVLNKKKKWSNPFPCKQVSEERGWGVKRYPSTHPPPPPPPPPPPWRFLDCNFIYSPLFLSWRPLRWIL